MSLGAFTAEQVIIPHSGRASQSVGLGRLEPSALEVLVRPYCAADRTAIRRLCCETGFLGNPVEPLFQDRELFADLFTRAYLEHEAEWALVAEVNGKLIGYLLGSVRPDFDRILMRCGFQTVTKMLFRLFNGYYAEHQRSREFIRWLIFSGFREQPRHPRDAAHLHLNVERAYRGRGVARRLWETFEQRLREAHVARCYGAFFSHSKRQPEAAYARFGFREFARRPTTLFKKEVRGRVEVVCVCKDF
jgi:ribosomal protein S18 acetylase RimI-like enzyme